MASADWALVSEYVVTPDEVRPAAVLVRGEKVLAVVSPDQVPSGCPIDNVGKRLVLPGLVDIHVHINEPGRTDWEGFATATRAAAAGGITTLVDMPLNSSPVTTTVDAFRQKLAAAEGKLWVDCGFHGGIVPGNTDQIEPLASAGVMGFKAFLCPSGIDEFPNVTEADLRIAMPKIAATGLPLLVHAELMSPLRPEVEERFAANPQSYAAYLANRPREWEHDAIRLMLDLCREYRCPVHIVHLASSHAQQLIEKARKEGLPFSVETCPHYLYFAHCLTSFVERIPDGEPLFKCAPPIRELADLLGLRRMVVNRLIRTIGSDHSPAPAEMKKLETGNLRRAWGGIASLQISLSVVLTALESEGCGFGILAEAMCQQPAALVGLQDRKGALLPGLDADLVVFDASIYQTISGEKLYHRHPITPYEGCTLRGCVERTYLRGKMVYEKGMVKPLPSGRAILRGR